MPLHKIPLKNIAGKCDRQLRLRINRIGGNKLEERIYFLHLPKCGGSSVHDALRNVASASAHLDPIASKEAAEAAGMSLMEYREQILLYYMSMSNLQYIGGHFRWSDTVYEKFSSSWRFVTIMRNPVDMWFSKYFYDRFKKSDHFKLDTNLEAYLESEAGQRLGSSMVEKFTDSSNFTGNSVTSQMALDRAIQNLEKFSLVGFLEDLDSFRNSFLKKFGVKLCALHDRKNPASSLQKAAKMDSSIRRRVEEVCQPNLELYEHALKANSAS